MPPSGGALTLKKSGIFPSGLLFFLASAVILLAQEDFLKIEASVIPRKLSRGQEGEVILKLTFQEGIIVSPRPDFTIEFKPCPPLIFPKNFYTATDLQIETVDREGEESLDFQKPIRIPFTVSLEAKKGSYILEGRIRYFARSGTEDWCVKNTAKFFATFSTRSTSSKRRS
ncbi:MAG: hypothetical protein AB1715_13190 [Acidobacteriota bacterium]